MGPACLIPGPCSRLRTRLFLESSFKPQPLVPLRYLTGSQVYLLSSGPHTHPVPPPVLCPPAPTHTLMARVPGFSLPATLNPDWMNWAPSEGQNGGYICTWVHPGSVLFVPGCVVAGLPLPFCEPASASLCEFNSATIIGRGVNETCMCLSVVGD